MEHTFGAFLAQRRKEKGLTQKELAQMLFVSESTVSKWEQGRANPDIAMLPSLCRILGVSEHELITASIDDEARENSRKAKKWTHLTFTWHLFFYIAYGVTLLTCFIVNLATAGRLSWFFIVLSSLLLASVFTTLPQFIRRYKLLILSCSAFAALLLLLGVCCIYTGGSWFWVSVFPCLLGTVMIFSPICIGTYACPTWLKKHAAVICIGVDTVLLGAMFYIIESYTNTTRWATAVALPILCGVALFALCFAAILRYLPTNRFVKAGISCALFALGYPTLLFGVQRILEKEFDIPGQAIFPPDFSNWSDAYINANITCIVVSVLVALAIVLGGIGLWRGKYMKQ